MMYLVVPFLWKILLISNTSQDHELWGRKGDDWLQPEVGIGTIHFLRGDTSIITISVQCQCVLSVSDEAMSGPQATAQCCQLAQSLASWVWVRHKVRIMHEGMKASAISRHPAVRYKPHFSWIMRSCVRHSSCFFVLGSIDILIFARMKVNVDHQTPDSDRDGAWDKDTEWQSFLFI